MLLAEVVRTSAAVASTSSRTAKRQALAGLLRQLGSEEVAAAVGFLVGGPRQGRVGLGWATVASVGAEPAPTPTLTIADVDRFLDRVEETGGAGSAGVRAALLSQLLGRATVEETVFLRRLLTGELRQGALAGVMTDAVAAAAGVPVALVRRAAMLSGDLGRTAALALTAGADGLAEVGLAVGRGIEPMLAATAAGVADALAVTGPASVEWKLDGIRVQVHRDGDDVRVFTRNLNDVTVRLPDLVAAARDVPADRFVLDGELLGLAANDEAPELFQDTASGFSRGDPAARAVALAPMFFDCLHVDGRDLLDEPLRTRAAALTRLVGPLRIPALETDDAGAAQEFLDAALATGHEGVMVKALDAPYEAGRRGKRWLKIKPVRTLDLVVLAAEWGHGRRHGRLSNLHLGARTPDGFVMVGKTFKGLTDAILEWQTAELLARETRREGIAVHVRPELVVEIALDGVQRSTRYPGGVALRFARVRRYRADKTAAGADSIDMVRALLPGTPGSG